MGTSFNCVQCHSHPYDPFKHDEYYKFMAFFNNTRDEDSPFENPVLRQYQGADNVKFESVKKWLQQTYGVTNPALAKKVFGLSFSNPVGLGAGFDKNALYLHELEVLGFGAVEIGTVTPLAQDGNPKPRLFRLPKDRALINRMGFNNDGVKVIRERLEEWKARGNRDQGVGNRETACLPVGRGIGRQPACR